MIDVRGILQSANNRESVWKDRVRLPCCDGVEFMDSYPTCSSHLTSSSESAYHKPHHEPSHRQ
jgi:hypothetical protein